MKAPAFAAALLLGGLTALGLSGCATEAFCFNDCKPTSTTDAAGGTGGATGGTGAVTLDGAGGSIAGTGGTTADQCAETNAGVEICDDIDNDCNGKVDDLADWTTVKACGSCDLRCDACPTDGTPCDIPQFVDDPTCQPPGVLDGTTKGTCTWTQCADDYWDNDGNLANGCEYFCQYNPTRDATKPDIGGTYPTETKGCFFDDDCDGETDEDVNLCNDVNNCGDCGHQCVLNNATSKCVTTATGTEPCTGGTSGNTHCEVDVCDAGWVNADGVAANGCEYQCTPTNGGVESCDGLDNDCDNKIDNTDADIEASEVGDPCWGGDLDKPVTQSVAKGVCADASHEGVRKCIGDKIQCCDVGSNNIASTNPQLPPTGLRNAICRATTGNKVVFPDDILETCNNLDDDCDGTKDNSVIDAGGTCGSSVGRCEAGTKVCDSVNRPTCTGSDCFDCQGDTEPITETCNGQDDNCDGVTDGTVVIVGSLPVSCTSDANCTGGAKCMPRSTGTTGSVCATPTQDVGTVCDVPNSAHPPTGTPVVCTSGTFQCVAGVKTCVGSVTRPISTPDSCGVDENCDGVLSGQPNLQTSLDHCGTCNNNCLAIAPAGHGQWTCNAGVCQRTGCDAGFIDCTGKGGDGDPNTCERACTFLNAAESCNGVDDNCNCLVDEAGMAVPSSTQVCGVSAAATDPNCTTNVTVSCQNGGWSCAFPSGYCSGTAPNYCSVQDACDNKDNNCNGAVDELYKTNSSLGQPCTTPTSDGACQGTGVFVCNTTQDGTTCNAVKKNCTTLPGGCTELCDNVDNDCDGAVDEPYTAKGANASFWVKPAVSQIGTSLYIYQYEASRPGATTTNPGSGLTVSCSVPNVVPWFNVTPTEVEQICTARGGRICNLSDWQTACHAPSTTCTWGYAPLANCSLAGTYGSSNDRICNIGLFDFDNNPLNGITNGLLPTASSLLFNCWADWPTDIFDITGNLREITKSGTNYTLMGGAYNTQTEGGATCDFTFFTVNATYKLFDVGFRCCFDTNPS